MGSGCQREKRGERRTSASRGGVGRDVLLTSAGHAGSLGCRVLGRCGRKLGRERGRTGPGFWDWAGVLGFAMGFRFLFPISYFKHYTNLIEFKFKFEFNPSTQTNKTMLQHECTNILSL